MENGARIPSRFNVLGALRFKGRKFLLKLKFSLFEEKKEKKRRRNTNFNSKTRYPKKHPFRESRVPDSLEDREERKRKKKNPFEMESRQTSFVSALGNEGRHVAGATNVEAESPNGP